MGNVSGEKVAVLNLGTTCEMLNTPKKAIEWHTLVRRPLLSYWLPSVLCVCTVSRHGGAIRRLEGSGKGIQHAGRTLRGDKTTHEGSRILQKCV